MIFLGQWLFDDCCNNAQNCLFTTCPIMHRQSHFKQQTYIFEWLFIYPTIITNKEFKGLKLYHKNDIGIKIRFVDLWSIKNLTGWSL